MTLTDILHKLADGISLTGTAREELHDAIAALDACVAKAEGEPAGDVVV